MSDKHEKSKLDQVIGEMTILAGEAALTAWKECVKKGMVGSMEIPKQTSLRMCARMFFLSGYALALLDHTMDAMKRMKAAADADQGQSTNRIKAALSQFVSTIKNGKSQG